MDFVFYFIGEREKSSLDHFFIEIEKKILLYQRHTATTSELYEREYKELKLNLDSQYNQEMKQANRSYEKIIAKGDFPDDEEAHSIAWHESGCDAIEYSFRYEEETLGERFEEIKDYFYKSTISTLYALLESELRFLCNLLKISFSKRLALQNLSDKDYLKSILTYLELVIEVQITSLHSFITKFQQLQFLRNKIMHNGGVIVDEEYEKLQNAITTSEEMISIQNVDGNKVIKINSVKYIDKYNFLIRDFFYELRWLIDETSGYQMLTEKFTFLFGYMAKETSVKITEVNKARNLIRSEIISQKEGLQFSLNCNISIIKSSKNEIELLNQTSGISRVEDLFKQLKGRPDILFEDILTGYVPLNMNSKIKITIYE
ncbi:hypothetical protein MRBLMN1_006259 [Chitinophaga ginsengisegetis]|uniref:hypothetical protein n=1 Tax=Chitinophaga ginsengisegetis TaxID=393003 RepID=UPI0034401777